MALGFGKCLQIVQQLRRVGDGLLFGGVLAVGLSVAAHGQNGQIFGLKVPQAWPLRRAKVPTTLEELRDVVMTAWLNPTPENVAKLPDYPQVQRLVSSPVFGQCAAAYYSAGDMIKRNQTYHVSDQIGRGDACAKKAGFDFADNGGAAQPSAPGQPVPKGARVNSNGCVVRGDSTKCPPSVSQMNQYAEVKMTPAEINRRMALSPSLTIDQLWQMGVDYNQKRMYTQAAGVFWQGANAGDPRAESALGNMYAAGRGVPEDVTLAMFWLGNAARAGNRGAQYAVAEYWEDGTQLPPNMRKAMSWYLKSAEQGFDKAELRVGFAYYFGETVPVNHALGLKWIRKSMEDGYGPAGTFLGILTDPRSPKFQTMDQFAVYVAKLQAVQTEEVLRIMASGFKTTPGERNGWETKARALESQGEYSRASSCRAIGTYC